MVGSRRPPISEVHGLASHGQAVPLLCFCLGKGPVEVDEGSFYW